MTKSGGGLVRCLSKAFRNAYKTLQKALVGTDEEEEAWRSCVDETNAVLGFASGAMFVRKHFRSASKKLVREREVQCSLELLGNGTEQVSAV